MDDLDRWIHTGVHGCRTGEFHFPDWKLFTYSLKFLAKPLVYTPTTRSQVVIAVSETNWVYLLDAATGVIVKKRQVRRKLHVVFLSWSWSVNSILQLPAPFDGATDLPCADIKGTTGITGTPVVERKTNTMYFFAKGYRGAAKGFSNGAYVSDCILVGTPQR